MSASHYARLEETKAILPTLSSKKTASSFLAHFVQENKDNPALLAKILLKGFTGPFHQVAFALDELTEEEKERLFNSAHFPLALKFYYLNPRPNALFIKIRGTKTNAVFLQELIEEIKEFPTLVHALKVKMAAIMGDFVTFWALLAQSKEYVNLYGCSVFLYDTPDLVYDFAGVNVKKSVLIKGSGRFNAPEADLTDADIAVDNGSQSQFPKATFTRTELSGEFKYTNFQAADLSEVTRFYFKSAPIGADFRAARLNDRVKREIRYAVRADSKKDVHPSFNPLKVYLNSLKDNSDFDIYVYSLLLLGSKSKKEFNAWMQVIPKKLQKEKTWWGGSRQSPFRLVLTQIAKNIPEILPDPSQPKSLYERVFGNREYGYVPQTLELQMGAYSLQPMHSHIVTTIVDIIKSTSFLHPSYRLIEQADFSQFVPAKEFAAIQLMPITVAAIQHRLKSSAFSNLRDYSPKSILLALEMMKAILYFNKFTEQAVPSLPTVKMQSSALTTELKLVLASQSTKKFDLDAPLNHSPLFDAIFPAIDARFKVQINPLLILSFMRMRNAQENVNLKINYVAEFREDCARELLDIWTHSQVGSLTLSASKIALRAKQLNEQANTYGYECEPAKFSPFSDNGLMDAINTQLQRCPEIIFGWKNNVVSQLANLLDATILERFIIGSESISRSVYYEGWANELVMLAITRAVGANILVVQARGLDCYGHRNPRTFYVGYDGEHFQALQFNPELKATRSFDLPQPDHVRATKAPLPSPVLPSVLSKAPTSLFKEDKAIAAASYSVASLSSMPVQLTSGTLAKSPAR